MASIIENLQAILTARYGRDVRNAIHDSISDLNEIANTAQTSAKAYYEGTQALAQTVSGNVGIDDSTATLSTTYSSHKIEDKTRTNLLNPTFGTATVNGVTCTNNGDGTYTVTGAVSSGNIVNFVIADDFELPLNTPLKLVGCPQGGGTSSSNIIYKLALFDHAAQHQVRYDYGNGSSAYTNDGTYNTFRMHLAVYAGAGTVNLTFKPMLTTDLSATYDDFVQYSGDGELNQNVAEMYKTIETLKNAITELGGTV